MVTVVLTTYNARRHLPAAARSVLRQTVRDRELIVVDGGSDDGTHRLLERMNRRHAARTIIVPGNRGPAALMNAGLAVARGRYVAFLEADDFWQPGYLAKAMTEFRTARKKITVCGCGVIDEAGRRIGTLDARGRTALDTGRWRLPEEDPVMGRLCGRIRAVCMSTVIVRRSMLVDLGGFDPCFRWLCADTDFIYRVALAYGRDAFAFIDEPMVLHRRHLGQLTRRLFLPRLIFSAGSKTLDAQQRQVLMDMLAFELKHRSLTVKRRVSRAIG